MATTVVRHNAIALGEEKQHLRIPVVSAEWPTVMKDNGPRVFRAPVLKKTVSAVFGLDRVHVECSSFDLRCRCLRRGASNSAKSGCHNDRACAELDLLRATSNSDCLVRREKV